MVVTTVTRTRIKKSLNMDNTGRVQEKVKAVKEEKLKGLGDEVSWGKRQYRL